MWWKKKDIEEQIYAAVKELYDEDKRRKEEIKWQKELEHRKKFAPVDDRYLFDETINDSRL